MTTTVSCMTQLKERVIENIMANIKTLKRAEIEALIKKYPIITYDDGLGIRIETSRRIRYNKNRTIRLFFGEGNRSSKILRIESIIQAKRMNLHPVLVQHVRDMYGGADTDMSDQFVKQTLQIMDYET